MLREFLASRCSNHAPKLFLATLVNGSEQIVSVIGDHEGNFPLSACDQSDIAEMSVHKIKRTLLETPPQLENAFRIEQLPVASVHDQQFDADSSALKGFRLRFHKRAKSGILRRRINRRHDQYFHQAVPSFGCRAI